MKRGRCLCGGYEEYATGSYTQGQMVQEARKWGLRNARGKQEPLVRSQINRVLQNPFYYGEMEVKGKRYPHVYTPLITKDLYDRCQAVRLGWHKKPFAYAGKDYIFRGRITCDTTGKTVTADTKTKRYQNGNTAEYTYLMCWNPEDPAKRMWVREDAVLAEVEQVFKNMGIDDDIYDDVIAYAQNTCDVEKGFHKRQMRENNREIETIQEKLNKLMDLLLEGVIEKTQYDEKSTSLRNRRDELTNLMNSYHSADDGFRDAVVDMLELAKKAHELFVSSNNPGKRRAYQFRVFEPILKRRKAGIPPKTAL